MNSVPALLSGTEFDLNPNIIFRAAPFHDVIGDIIKPTCLIPSCSKQYCYLYVNFTYGNELIQLTKADPNVEFQFRIALLENVPEHKDKIPEFFILVVNGETVSLPPPIKRWIHLGVPLRSNKPIDITPHVKIKAGYKNWLKISWMSKNMELYVFTLRLVRKTNSNVLVQKLNNSRVRNPDYTKAIIKEKIENDLCFGLENLNLSLICPLGKIRMRLPCRTRSCTHIQCFDGATFVQMNERGRKWACPICHKPADFNTLLIDGLFLEVIQKVPAECTEVQFRKDGSWHAVTPMKTTSENDKATTSEIEAKNKVECIVLDSDSDNEDIAGPSKMKKE